MKFIEYLLNEEEATEKRKEDWAEATDKRRNNLKSKGLFEGRFWVKKSTNSGLQTLKTRYELEHVGEVIDKLVSQALKGGKD